MKDISLPFHFKTHPIRLIFYAVFFSIMLFLILPLSKMFQDAYEKKIIVRSIDIVAEPPKPPSSQKRETENIEEEIVNIQAVESEIEIVPLDLNIDVSLTGDFAVKIGVGDFINAGAGNIIGAIKMFALNELDQTPRSLNDPIARVPKSLTYTDITAEVLVILTETGSLEFLQFISISHDEAKRAVQEYVRKLKYTPAMKDGVIGRTRFRLPLQIRGDARPKGEQPNEKDSSAAVLQ
jgi:hypothetical protein